MIGGSWPTGSPGRWRRWILCLAAAVLLFPTLAAAQPGTRDGLFVTVPNPITDSSVQQIRQVVEDGFRGRTLSTVVFDFNPNELPAGTSNFGACNELAELIRSLQEGFRSFPQVTTVAFVHNETTQHTVLAVLACKQIIMSAAVDDKTRRPRAQLGDVQRGLERELSLPVRLTYQKLAEDNALGDLVERMLNKDFTLKKVKTAEGTHLYLGPATIARWQKDGKKLQVESDLPPGLEVGSALFDAETARRVGLCEALYDTRAELAAAKRLSRRSLAEDWLAGRTRVAWRIEVKGQIDKASLNSLERRIKTAISRNANLIILQLEASGGETVHVDSLARSLRKRTDDATGQPIKVVAWVPPGASLGAATFLALGSSEIVMGEGAVLGDFSYLQNEKDEDLERRRAMLVDLAKEQGYPPLLFEATLDRKLKLYRVVSLLDPSNQLLVTEADSKADNDSPNPKWRKLGLITNSPDGQFLKITSALASEWGVSNATSISSVDALYAHYGLESAKVRVARDDWLDRVAEFFREPVVNFILVMLGIAGFILELKMPGTSVPGVISAVCFVLFFWAYSFVGEFTLLAVLLFVLGVVLVAVEIFIIPGFGFTGVSGLLLIITGLGLVTLERWPSTTQDWVSLGTTLGTFAGSLMAAVLSAILVAWYLPSIPYANRLVLNPPATEEEVEPAVPVSLLGAIGVAATTLRPAGKAQFGDDFLDVIAEGDYVNPGQRVQVIEIEGNRIVVKEV